MMCFKNLTFSRTSLRLLGEIELHVSKTLCNGVSSWKNKLQVDELVPTNSKTKFEIKKWTVSSTHNQMRTVSTAQTQVETFMSSTRVFSEKEKNYFISVFPDIRNYLIKMANTEDDREAKEKFGKLLDYLTTGKMNRGLSTVLAYKMLESSEQLTTENIRLANILGWCLEMLGNYFLMVDDIMDGSELRRGIPCWYRNKEIGLRAINDGLLLESCVYLILKKYFSHLQCYIPILELFHDSTIKSSMGQSLDGLCLKNGKPRLDEFTMERFKWIVKYKTSLHGFHLPVALGMYLSNIYDEEKHRQAKMVSLEIGEFFQTRDDFLDVFGHTSETGKKGSDIKQGKCSWLAVTALERGSPAHRKIMEEHYGCANDESVAIIRRLFDELQIEAIYEAYEKDQLKIIKSHIDQLPNHLPHDLFFTLIKMFYYKRDP